MKKPTIVILAIAFVLLLLALLAGPCVITSNPSIPAAEPDAIDDSGPADPDSTGAP